MTASKAVWKSCAVAWRKPLYRKVGETVNLKIDDISRIIKDQIKTYASKTEQDEIGYVIQVGDGIAKVHGLDMCKSNELLSFDNGSYGMALNLEETYVSVVMLGTRNNQGLPTVQTADPSGQFFFLP